METEKKKAAFDISVLAAVDEADMEITDAEGSGTGWIWTLAGPGHPVTIEADRRQSQRFLERENEKERVLTNGRKWKGEAPKVEDRRAEGIAYVVSRVLRWRMADGSEMMMNGEPFPFTPENATKVLAHPQMPLVYEQLNAFLVADKSFSKRSARG